MDWVRTVGLGPRVGSGYGKTRPKPLPFLTDAKEEEDTLSMRELVQEIDSHVELINLEIISNPNFMQGSIQP